MEGCKNNLKQIIGNSNIKQNPKVELNQINNLSKTIHSQINWKNIWLQKHKKRANSEINSIVKNKKNNSIEENIKNAMKKWSMSKGSLLINKNAFRNSKLSFEERMASFDYQKSARLKIIKEKLEQKFNKFKSRSFLKRNDSKSFNKRKFSISVRNKINSNEIHNLKNYSSLRNQDSNNCKNNSELNSNSYKRQTFENLK